MLKPDYEKRPSAQKILKFSTLRSIEKRDKKKPRINYAVSRFYKLVILDLK